MIPIVTSPEMDYKGAHDLSSLVADTILDRKVPSPDQISGVFGKDVVNSYFFMHVLTHSREYGNRSRISNYGRRDQKAMPRHPYDAARKPYFRLRDRRLPSGYDLTLREIKSVLVHDLGEEFGKSPLAALVVNDIISQLLGEETRG